MPHIHDKIDFCSEVYVVHKNTVLLRKHDKLKKWLSVGGHIELYEDPNEAAIREVKEEVGLDVILYAESKHVPVFHNKITSLIPPIYVIRHKVFDNHEHIGLIFFATSSSNILKLSKTEITDACKWFTKKELQNYANDIDPYVQYYALEALKKLSKI